ncbi:MAG: hypothetical protein JNM42_16695 [Propionivibrio sp.]|uniref:DUF6600 domain-containing protein n=1 Tax=Propionivibrio sp. TaxID=2212460 RepID=UPI001A3BDE69|nr:DUF6600 domain-containing protein [Propionivibrio sp.]MBL8416071.1 hypothetical protein [Propionivibrio sp.]
MNSPLFSSRPWYCLLALLACVLFLVTPAQADPAGRIGRIAWLSGAGAVNLYNPNTGESYSAALNQPLTSGDTLTTVAGARAEIQIGSMSVRLDSGSMLEITRIDDDQVRLYLNEGRAIVKLPSREIVRDFELVTRNGRFSARDAGIYRFDADSGSSSATAYFGALHFEASDSALDIGAGQSAQFWQQAGGQTRYRLSSAVNDDFTEWSVMRDRRPTANTYARYVSPEMTGAEDLDAYGNWSENAEYGAIWTPRAVAADWAPYRSGHWVWVAPWGWNWVGYEPWGFAPFHYGRWVHQRGAWGWVPGARIARPVYAPAMVAWIGTPGIGAAIGGRPNVGWFPLAPHEVYVPAYRSSANYIRNVNITHVNNISNVTNIVNNPQAVVQQTHYRHRELPQAVTVVPADVVTHRRPVAPAALSPGNHRSLRDHPVQAIAPVSAPQAAAQTGPYNRQDRQNQAFTRRDSERQATPVTTPANPGILNDNPPVASTAAQLPATMPQRGERPMPESVRPAPLPRPEALAPVRPNALASGVQAAPQVETQNRQDRPGQPSAWRERQQQEALVTAPAATGSRIATPPALAPAPQASVLGPQRNERPQPEVVRPVMQTRPEPFETRVQDRPSRRDEPAMNASQLAPAPQAPVLAPQRNERPQPEIIRPVPQSRTELMVSAPAATRNREAIPPALAPAPQAPVLAPQRNERPQPEVVRPVPQSRPEPFETRVQDRPSRRNEPTINPPQSAIRIEPPAQQFRQATPARMETPPPMVRETRHEAPREISRPAEPRAEARTQNQGDRQRQGQNDQEKKRQQRDEAEKR